MKNIFVSYCQKDSVYADNIDLYFKEKDINIHRDIRDISNWKSIREYMNSIREMDYAILIITDNYLKSFNCMYEVLEVIKEKNYESKIFPVVIETSIYSAIGRIPYIKYWEDKFEELKHNISQINFINTGNLIDDLKRTQNICSSIEEFLSKVADMNNPNISDVNLAIENKLKEQSILTNEKLDVNSTKENTDIFSCLNIPKVGINSEVTDLDKNKFMKKSFEEINNLLKELCNQLNKENNGIVIEIEQVDNKTLLYQFYKNGNNIRGLRLFLGKCFGIGEDNIGLSSEIYSYSNGNSFNGIISNKVENGNLGLYFSFGMSFSQECKSVEEIVREIWMSYIQPYISR